MKEKIAFVILSWNAEGYLKDCLDSVFLLPYELQVLLVDNGSTDKTRDILSSFGDKENLEVIFLPKNMGTTKTRNMALRKVAADVKWICILDSDTKVNDAAISALIEALENNEKALLASPRMWNAIGEEQHSCKRFPTVGLKIQKALPFSSCQEKAKAAESYSLFPEKNLEKTNPPVAVNKNVYKVDYAISACWMMKREILEKVGFLDEKIFYAPEDVEYCVRVWKAGYTILFVSGASIYHLTQRLSRKKLISKINWEHIKGLFYFFRKHRAFLRKRKKQRL